MSTVKDSTVLTVRSVTEVYIGVLTLEEERVGNGYCKNCRGVSPPERA